MRKQTDENSEIGGEEFPEAIIQRIQSLLTRKEAAQTTILSKSWHGAWLTQPNLVLDESDFKPSDSRDLYYAINEFSKYAKKTMKRYEQSNLVIDSFKLCVNIDCYGGAALVRKLIVKALTKLGATRLDLQINSSSFCLPQEVFGADNLVELSVKGCKITLDGGRVVKCCRLEHLCLDRVDITSHGLSNIISSCPLIEKLSLSDIYHCSVDGSWHGGWDDPVATGPIVYKNPDRIKCLVLSYESFTKIFQDGLLLSEFPFLTDLTLNKKMHWQGDVEISNRSLEYLKIELEKENISGISQPPLKITLDVPRIRKFSFEGEVIPKLSLISTPIGGWESHVSIEATDTTQWEPTAAITDHNQCYGYRVINGNGNSNVGGPTVFWFRELNQLLTELRSRQSKIHLSLSVECSLGSDYMLGDDLSVTRKHELESLAIDMSGLPSFSCYALLDGLFRMCRPKLITQIKEVPKREKTNVVLLWHVLEQGMYVSIPRQLMYGLNDLEEVNAQIFDGDATGWGPTIPLKLLLLLGDQVQQQQVRLLLKWKPSF